MLARTIEEELTRTGQAPANTMSVLVEQLKRTHEQVRRLSRGLMPVEVDGEGLGTSDYEVSR